MKLRFFIILLFLTVSISCLHARRVNLLPYDEMFSKSDLVVIIEWIENENAKDQLVIPPGYTFPEYDGINTSFKIHTVLKGDFDKSKSLVVLHFDNSVRMKVDVLGADFIHFPLGPNEDPINGGHIWIAFLKKRADGRFEPVTGQLDSKYSFRELHESH